MRGVTLRTSGDEREPSAGTRMAKNTTRAIGAGSVAIIVLAGTAAFFANRSADRNKQEILDGISQDNLTLVEDIEGNTYRTEGGTKVHIELGAGGCSAWVDVIEVDNDPDDTQRYLIELGGLQYNFTNYESMIGVMGENPCQPVTLAETLD